MLAEGLGWRSARLASTASNSRSFSQLASMKFSLTADFSIP